MIWRGQKIHHGAVIANYRHIRLRIIVSLEVAREPGFNENLFFFE